MKRKKGEIMRIVKKINKEEIVDDYSMIRVKSISAYSKVPSDFRKFLTGMNFVAQYYKGKGAGKFVVEMRQLLLNLVWLFEAYYAISKKLNLDSHKIYSSLFGYLEEINYLKEKEGEEIKSIVQSQKTHIQEITSDLSCLFRGFRKKVHEDFYKWATTGSQYKKIIIFREEEVDILRFSSADYRFVLF